MPTTAKPFSQQSPTIGYSGEGLVLRTLGYRARVLINGERTVVVVPGKWRLTSKGVRPLAPGDRVILERSADDWKLIKLSPRKNEFTRRAPGPKPSPQIIAVNLDRVVIVASAAHPATPFGLVDRLLVTASLGNVPVILVVNKIDCVKSETIAAWEGNYHYAVKTLLFTSAVTGQGVDKLASFIRGRTVLLAGSSGVGKSTLANSIDPDLDIKTREISESTDKGRHTTSITELYAVAGGGWIGDTPGLRECAPWNMTPLALANAFAEIAELGGNCHFRNCLHENEIHCNVTPVVGTPQLPIKRYQSYLKLLQQAKLEQKGHLR